MSIFSQWPWVSYNEYNLDWVIKKVKSIEDNITQLVIDATSSILDATLTDPTKAAQAKVTGDEIRANASNITNLQGRMTTAEGTITADGLRITALEAEGVHTYRMELFKSDPGLTYYDKVKATITDMTNLIADVNNDTPYIVLMDGNLAYGINVQISGGNTIIYGKTQVGNSIYNFQIYSNSVTGTATIQSSSVTPHVMIISAGNSFSYFTGSYDVLQTILLSRYSWNNVILRLNNYSGNFTTIKEWYGNSSSYDQWIYLIFNNGDEIKCDYDGTITKMN